MRISVHIDSPNSVGHPSVAIADVRKLQAQEMNSKCDSENEMVSKRLPCRLKQAGNRMANKPLSPPNFINLNLIRQRPPLDSNVPSSKMPVAMFWHDNDDAMKDAEHPPKLNLGLPTPPHLLSQSRI